MNHKIIKENRKIFVNAAQYVLEAYNTPYSLRLFKELNDGQTITQSYSPYDFEHPGDYLDYVQVVGLFKKNTLYKDSTKEAYDLCKAKWFESEAQCGLTNKTFPILMKENFHQRSFFETVRHFCHRILDKPFLGKANFGPGASFKLAGEEANYISKLLAKPECTAVAHRHVLLTVLDQMPHYAISCGLVTRTKHSLELSDTKLPLVRGNRFSTVPKTVEVDRPIGIEPLGNMLVQKALGDAIKCRLKNYGLNIDKQADLHRQIVSTKSRAFATLDLSSASDTIASSLVRWLIPDEWYQLLDTVRSRYTLVDEEWIELNKFSSMGNGFTFELETLIFYAIMLACRYHYGSPSDFVSSFGDDMILPVRYAEKAIAHLEAAGFTINVSKSFISGPFRESCGEDTWLDKGVPVKVRPINYQPDLTNDPKTFLLKMYHTFYRAANHGNFIDSRYKKALVYLRAILKSKGFFIVPRSFSPDSGFYPLPGDKLPSRGKTSIRVYKRKGLPLRPDNILSCALYGISSSGLVTRSSKFHRKVRHSSFRSHDRELLYYL